MECTTTDATGPAVDLWDSSGAFWYRFLPPATVVDLFRQDNDLLTITEERDGFWLSNAREAGETPFGSLDLAKAAGDKVIEDLTNTIPENILKDAGLDPEVWTFEPKEPASFTYKHNIEIVIVADNAEEDPSKRWSAWNGEALVGEYGEPEVAAGALLQQYGCGI